MILSIAYKLRRSRSQVKGQGRRRKNVAEVVGVTVSGGGDFSSCILYFIFYTAPAAVNKYIVIVVLKLYQHIPAFYHILRES